MSNMDKLIAGLTELRNVVIDMQSEQPKAKCSKCAGTGIVLSDKPNAFGYDDCPKCQIEPPNPLLADAKVGDWVEIEHFANHDIKHVKVTALKHDLIDNCVACGNYIFNTNGEDSCYRLKTHGYKITRILPPSEVVVRIGCLSGQVRYCASFGFDGIKHDAIKMFNGGGKCIAIIHLDALDATTRQLVESLLCAQEEK